MNLFYHAYFKELYAECKYLCSVIKSENEKLLRFNYVAT